ncbi:7b6fe81e-944f-40e4-bacb-22286acc6e52 [Thermothielavioides terrestris]|uniref:7b6fe81e-944f-40e4-bacb-22286acc6e52 n=1 Tax=Thermothielavioides terrestris TaxID=2587410 RepID=A0A446BAX7_9PEZI|nr:7b6fe81e-944f-40e4-bacb-22286acc6e52 [Thermothielavioides terrestris]
MAASSPPSQLPPVPASPTQSYASTANPLSQYNLPLPPPPRPAHAVLTKTDLEHSQAAYAELLASAKAYRLALASLSTAASAFGAALESCARLKEARADALGPPAGAPLTNSFTSKAAACTADTLLTVAGLQHLVANHQHILSETVYRAFEVPLLHELDKWRAAVEDEEERYARDVAAQGREIRRLEKEGLKLHRQRRRDVARFRGHLVELTAKLDGLTVLHAEHARTLLRESQEASAKIVEASCSLTRAEVDIFESLARKGWTGGGLEDVLEKGVDLFAAEMDPLSAAGKSGGVDGVVPGEGATLFSILPPKSILADTAGTDTLRGGKDTRSDSLLMDTDRYQSLAGAMSSDTARDRDRDTDSVFSEPSRSRNVRPFSPQPQPLRLNPEDLLGSLENGTGESSSGPGEEDTRKGDGNTGEGDDGCAVEDDHRDGQGDEEADPWRDEGLRRETQSDNEDQGKAGGSRVNLQHREEGWRASGNDI